MTIQVTSHRPRRFPGGAGQTSPTLPTRSGPLSPAAIDLPRDRLKSLDDVHNVTQPDPVKQWARSGHESHTGGADLAEHSP